MSEVWRECDVAIGLRLSSRYRFNKMKQKIEGGKKSKWTAGDRLFFSMLPSKSTKKVTPTPIQETWQEEFEKNFCDISWYKPDSTALNSGMKCLVWKGEMGKETIANPHEVESFIQTLLQRKERETIEACQKKIKEANLFGFVTLPKPPIEVIFSGGVDELFIQYTNNFTQNAIKAVLLDSLLTIKEEL